MPCLDIHSERGPENEPVGAERRKSTEGERLNYAPSQLFQNTASRFLCVSNEEVADMWKRHVQSLGHCNAGAQTVHTHFLFVRLFPVLRQQLTVLTREACSYLGQAYITVASHFLVTVELLGSQFRLPRVYIDSELLVRTRLAESHVFLTLEMDENLDTYYDRRHTVLQRLEQTRQQLRQQSRVASEQVLECEDEVHSCPEKAMLELCQAVHRLHFQLLVLLGSYIKMLDSLQPHLESSGGVEMSQELAEVWRNVEESVQLLGRAPSPLLEQGLPAQHVEEAVRALEDSLSQRQWSQAVLLLRAVRRQNREVEEFGGLEDDDTDCLFFIYARFLMGNQEGKESVALTVHHCCSSQECASCLAIVSCLPCIVA
jgi:hypothetical protein